MVAADPEGGGGSSLKAVGALDETSCKLLDALQDGMVVADLTNTIIYANVALERVLGWAPEDLIGQPLITLIPLRLQAAHEAAFARYFETGEEHIFGQPIRVPAMHADGTERQVELILSPLEMQAERLVVGGLRDVTRSLELERQVSLAERLIDAMGDAATYAAAGAAILQAICETLGWDVGGLWVVEPTTGDIHCDAVWHSGDYEDFTTLSLTHIMRPGQGLPGQVAATGKPAWVADIPNDPNFVRKATASDMGLRSGFCLPIRSDADVIGAIEFFSADARTPDEELLATMSTLASHLGGFIVSKRQEDQMRYQNILLEAISQNTLEGILIMNTRGRVVTHNQRFLEMWRVQEELVEDSRRLLDELVARVVDGDAFRDEVRRLREDPGHTLQQEVHLRTGHIYDTYSAPLRSPNGRFYGRAFYFRNVTESRRAEEELARSSQRFQRVAMTLQRHLAPPDLPQLPGLETAATYEPAAEGLIVGGDFYDVIEAGEGRWAIAIGDASGKGADAAAIAGQVRQTLRAIARGGRGPAEVIEETNAVLAASPQEDDRYCTVLFATLEREGTTWKLETAAAGHPLPLLLCPDGRITQIGEVAPPIGLFPDLEVTQSSIELTPGDALVVLTDGTLDAGAPDAPLGIEGVIAALEPVLKGTARDMANAIEEAARRAVAERGGRDDRAALVIRCVEVPGRRRTDPPVHGTK